jgi:endonuclease/exonuclease/phosphatase family metal-dependent hydrolase
VLRILHWNIHSWRDAAGEPNAEAVIALIRDTKPHVVSLTEVIEPWGAPSTLAGISDKCGYSWIFVPSIEFGADPVTRGYGNAILTRLPVTAVQQVRVYSPEHRYDGTEPNETRSVALVRLPVAGASVWFGSTHFPATHHSSRKAAAQTLRQLGLQLSTPWIVCGDFNAPAAALFEGRSDVRVYPEPAEPTFPADRPTVPIDYVLTSPEVVLKTEVLRASGSDHLPLVAVARLA